MTTNDKEERKKWDKNYRERNQEKIKESQKKYQDSESGKAKRKEWRDDNPDKILESNRKYEKNNRDKCNIRRKKYYYTIKGLLTMLKKHDSRRLGIKSQLTIKILEIIDNRDKKCVYCGKEFDDKIEHDHINPFKPFSKFNIVKSCRNCNRSKLNSDMIQWMNFKGYKISQKLLDLYKKAYE